ncbi:MAG: phosphoribosylamine--glycine ligase [Clostridiaceae bacterium]|nr:phosphoribosylamine--glycine ligase [Clostridiaceae bacterium]
MKLLIIGNGGREHAIAWKVAQSPLVEIVYCAPGNGGTHVEDKCKNIKIYTTDELLDFAKKEEIDLTIVGPEANLVVGIVDAFKAEGLKIFGPAKGAARLEGSKSYSKDFMKKYGVRTAAYEVFEEIETAIGYLKTCEFPIVIKADGLAAGKGVVISQSFAEAENTLKEFMVVDIFQGSGKKVVIEEFLDGVEASILSITDGKVIIPFLSSKDHKCIFDGDLGPNTGGMGAVAPNPYCNEEVLKVFNDEILTATLRGIQEENMDYCGIIFFGIMITKKGTYLLEYNVRMGDPETQVVLPLMENDFVELILAAIDGKLSETKVTFKARNACCVVGASMGYPAPYPTGLPITIGEVSGKVFIAGGEIKGEEIVTSGGRVLTTVALGETLQEAIDKAYKDLKHVHFEGMYFRKDIGKIKELP